MHLLRRTDRRDAVASDKSGAPIADGVLQTTGQAIHFADQADFGTAVAAARYDPRNDAFPGELNVRPRTTYLAALTPHAAA